MSRSCCSVSMTSSTIPDPPGNVPVWPYDSPPSGFACDPAVCSAGFPQPLVPDHDQHNPVTVERVVVAAAVSVVDGQSAGFLYPENYLLPENWRLDASPFFSDLENDLRQTDCDADAAEAAYQNYLRKLVLCLNLKRLPPITTKPRPMDRWCFTSSPIRPERPRSGTTATAPPCREPTGVWIAWQQLNLDIHSSPVIPVIWDRRLFLLAQFQQQSEQASGQSVPSGGGGQSPAAQVLEPSSFLQRFHVG